MIAVIPSIGESPYLPDLLTVLLADVEIGTVLVVDNSPHGHPSAVQVVATEGVEASIESGRLVLMKSSGTIYDAWNRGIALASSLDEPVAVLNDDIVLPAGSLRVAGRALLGYGLTLCGLEYTDRSLAPPSESGIRDVFGTYRTGGFGGFAFVLAPGCPSVDPRFRWWYGDDDLAERVKAVGGRMAVALGAPVQHPAPSTTGHRHGWTHEAVPHDAELFRRLWPLAA